MKLYKIVKTTAQLLIGFGVLSVFVIIFSAGFYFKADDTSIKPSDITSISTVLDRGLEFLEYFLGTLAFIGVVISAIQFGTTGGDATKAAKAKKSLLYCCIGVVISVLSYALTKIVFGMLG